MSQRITNAFVNTNRPGSYFDLKVKSTPVGVASSGNIVIIGEAKGGAAGAGVDSVSGDELKDNFFTPDQLDRVVNKYISGPIVDAFRALSSSSSDADITGSANRIYISKTNKGSQASAVIASTYGTLKDKNWGIDGTKYYYQVTQSAAEVAASVTSGTISAFGAALDGLSFTIRDNGAVATVITLGVGGHADLAATVAEIDGLLPADLECVVSGADALIIRFTAVANNVANAIGHGKSFELNDSTPGDLAAITLVEGLSVSSQEPEVQVDINRQDTGVNEQLIVEGEVAMSVGYEGTSGTLTISGDDLTTTVVGGSGANLAIDLAEYTTIKDVADYINAQTGYTASVESGSTQKVPSALDEVTAITIASTGAGLKPGRIKSAASNFASKVGESTVLDFTATAVIGLPDEMSAVAYLSGGAKGATSAANIVSAIDDLEGINTNFVIPLFSRDATADISDGLTDSASTYTINAVNAATKSHVLKMSTAKVKKHRSAFLSYWGTFQEIKESAGSLAHYRVSLTMQRTSQVNSVGTIVSHMPWHTACIAAGMQAGGFYKAIVNKFANVISFTDPSGFDSGNGGDIETALDAGLLFMEKAVVGNKWVSDQTTYGVDTNFVYNSIQAVYAADLVSLDLTASFQTAFVGKSLADVDASTGLSFLASKMDVYKKQKLIAASDDAPLAFKNAKVSISGPIMEVSVEIKLATAIYFIPINIEISQVTSAA